MRLLVCGAAIALTAVSCGSGAAKSATPSSAAPPATEDVRQTTDPLGDRVPGLGTSASNVLRDETIWSYLAYRREADIAVCMTEEGFDYAIDVRYPREALLRVLDQFELNPDGQATVSSFQAGEPAVRFAVDGTVQAASVGLMDAAAWNEHAVRMAEQSGELDSYFLALYGVTAEERTKGGGNAGCRGEAGIRNPANWPVREELLTAQAQTLRLVRGKAIGECAAAHGLSASSPGDLETVAENASDLAVAEECLIVWDRAAIAERGSEEFGEFVEWVEQQFVGDIARLNSLHAAALRDQAFAQVLSTARDAPKIPLPADEAIADPHQEAPSASAFLDAVPLVLGLEFGPGMPENHPNLELFWKGEEVGATAALTREDAFSDSDGIAFVVFSCDQFELGIIGPLDTASLVDAQWLPVDPELIELVLSSYGGECRLR